MINIDGVIVGNYRTSLSGMDLNRYWKSPSAIMFPEIKAIKKMARNFMKKRDVALYCDLHGHSRSRQVFMYGNECVENPFLTKLFPFIMSELSPEFFEYKNVLSVKVMAKKEPAVSSCGNYSIYQLFIH